VQGGRVSVKRRSSGFVGSQHGIGVVRSDDQASRGIMAVIISPIAGRARHPRSARRGAQAATRFFKRLLKSLHNEARVIVTDKLRSYGVAQRELLPGVAH
jgi:hypothetical protein